jgi:hypothetical protein
MGARGRANFLLLGGSTDVTGEKKKAHTVGAGRWAPLGKQKTPIILALKWTENYFEIFLVSCIE